MKRYILIISYLVLLVVIGAIGDGLNNSGETDWGHLINALEIALLFICARSLQIITWRGTLLLLLSYAFIRAGLFDQIRNLVAGQEFFYFGGKNWWDKFFVMMPPFGVVTFKIVFLMVGVALPIRERL